MSKKSWLKSKGVWLGICTASIGVIEVLQAAIISHDLSALGILTTVAGVAKVFERVMRNNSDVTL